MLLAIVLGALSGAVGVLPLFLGLRMTRRVTNTSNLGHTGALMLGVLLSFIVLFLAAIACVVLARESAVPFVLAEAAVLVAAAVGYGVYTFVRK